MYCVGVFHLLIIRLPKNRYMLGGERIQGLQQSSASCISSSNESIWRGSAISFNSLIFFLAVVAIMLVTVILCKKDLIMLLSLSPKKQSFYKRMLLSVLCVHCAQSCDLKLCIVRLLSAFIHVDLVNMWSRHCLFLTKPHFLPISFLSLIKMLLPFTPQNTFSLTPQQIIREIKLLQSNSLTICVKSLICKGFRF